MPFTATGSQDWFARLIISDEPFVRTDRLLDVLEAAGEGILIAGRLLLLRRIGPVLGLTKLADIRAEVGIGLPGS